MRISRVGAFSLGWGESLLWDDGARRLYFADCAAQTIHWLEEGQEELHTFQAPSMPTGACGARCSVVDSSRASPPRASIERSRSRSRTRRM